MDQPRIGNPAACLLIVPGTINLRLVTLSRRRRDAPAQRGVQRPAGAGLWKSRPIDQAEASSVPTPAQAIITALSVQSASGGATKRQPAFFPATRSSSVVRNAVLAATPPEATKASGVEVGA